MYQRSNVLHERQNDGSPFSVPILIGGRWVRCDRGRRLFPESSGPETDQVSDLLKKESDNCEEKWNFNFLTERPNNGDWEWIPREDHLQSGMDQEDDENEDGEDDDDGDLQEVVEVPNDSEDDNDGRPETKRSRMVPVLDISDAN